MKLAFFKITLVALFILAGCQQPSPQIEVKEKLAEQVELKKEGKDPQKEAEQAVPLFGLPPQVPYSDYICTPF